MQFNGQVDMPPPSMVASRFSEKLGAAIEAFRTSPSPQNEQAIREALGSADQVDRQISERRQRALSLLRELESEMTELGEDIGFRDWIAQPTMPYRKAVLNAAMPRRAMKQAASASALIESLQGIAGAEKGFFDPNAPGSRGLMPVGSLIPRPGDYATSEPGSEALDMSGRISGSEAA